jgi:hypothetical protein
MILHPQTITKTKQLRNIVLSTGFAYFDEQVESVCKRYSWFAPALDVSQHKTQQQQHNK